MSKTKFDERFFNSTRGRIVLLLRVGARTVNQLADELQLTDNAVRSHLLSLERDGVIESAGLAKGFRKPHATYRLTADARHLFPSSYDSLLIRLIDVLKQKLSRPALISILKNVGTKIANEQSSSHEIGLDEKVNAAILALEKLGGAAVAEKTDDALLIRSESCPFADAVIEHPEICKATESLIREIVDEPVHETCDRTALPKCRFVIGSA